MLSHLAGRWSISVEGGDASGMVVIEAEGRVTIVGESDDLELKQDEQEGCYRLTASGTEEALCAVKTTKDDGGEDVLRCEGLGHIEIWHRVQQEDGTPKIVARRGGGLERRWTREDQVGSPKCTGSRRGKKDPFALEEEAEAEADEAGN
mmetsp:Transcript_50852/g.149847  ORF Transcript_50852/g.149847 Transcript_50852/m.149847 type:complete len:149 (+) Transcript_50852:80-526(+)